MNSISLAIMNVFDDAERIYLEKGIVTRNDLSSLDMRSFGRLLKGEMEKRGYHEAMYLKFALEEHINYSGILFNSEEYSADEAERYMMNFVLTDKF